MLLSDNEVATERTLKCLVISNLYLSIKQLILQQHSKGFCMCMHDVHIHNNKTLMHNVSECYLLNVVFLQICWAQQISCELPKSKTSVPGFWGEFSDSSRRPRVTDIAACEVTIVGSTVAVIPFGAICQPMGRSLCK